MPSKSPKSRAREPVQVYLDPPDRLLLEQVAQKTGLTRAEVLRRGLRRLAERTLAERAPGWSMETLVGSLHNVENPQSAPEAKRNKKQSKRTRR